MGKGMGMGMGTGAGLRRRRMMGGQGPTGPLVLAIESGGDHLGVALLRLPEEPGRPLAEQRLLESIVSHRGHRHADAVLLVIHDALSRHGLRPQDLGLIAVARGPGGFTGVRVGMATGSGLALGLDAPVWQVDSLEALAVNAAGHEAMLVPLIDARKGEVFGAAYRVDAALRVEQLMEPTVGRHDAVLAAARAKAGGAEPVVFGSGALAYQCASPVPPGWHVPSPWALAALAALGWDTAGRPARTAPPDPRYVRKSEAEIAAERREG